MIFNSVVVVIVLVLMIKKAFGSLFSTDLVFSLVLFSTDS